jgi:hypothetical protein
MADVVEMQSIDRILFNDLARDPANEILDFRGRIRK